MGLWGAGSVLIFDLGTGLWACSLFGKYTGTPMLRAYFCMHVILQQKGFGYFPFGRSRREFSQLSGVDLILKVHSMGLAALDF